MKQSLLLEATDHQGAKGPIIFGANRLLVYERDRNTDYQVGCLDFPGGGSEVGETVFQTYSREVNEEFGLRITKSQVVFIKKYSSIRFLGKTVYFLVVNLPESEIENIVFGPEGKSYQVMSINEYLSSPKGIDYLKDRLQQYISLKENK